VASILKSQIIFYMLEHLKTANKEKLNQEIIKQTLLCLLVICKNRKEASDFYDKIGSTGVSVLQDLLKDSRLSKKNQAICAEILKNMDENVFCTMNKNSQLEKGSSNLSIEEIEEIKSASQKLENYINSDRSSLKERNYLKQNTSGTIVHTNTGGFSSGYLRQDSIMSNLSSNPPFLSIEF
jgi:hypothetical protein